MKRLFFISAIAFCLLASISAYSANFASPSLTISGNSNVVKLQTLKIEVKIIGSMATTTCDMTFVNTSSTLLEGELNFPLMQGQNISEFWMELNGKLRKAVPVEKAKGRAVYEEIVRRNVDPALLEKTEGNNFRMRVYPINPNSTKRIVISYQEILSENESGKRYFLPLYYNSEIKNFSMDLAVFDENVVNPKTNSELSEVNTSKDSNGYYIKVSKKDYSLNTGFEFLFANSSSEKLVYAEKYNNKSYFMANVRLFSEPNSRPIPKNISIYYDISHSGYLKNLEKEIALWKAYLSSFDNVNVNLYTFNLIEQKKYSFACGADKNDKFIDFIENIKYDGASSYNQLNYQNDNADLIIVFTDGMINYLSKDFPKSPKPLIILNANQFADELSLKKNARQNDGVYINLLANELDDALESMKHEANILQKINVLSGSVSEIYPADKSEFKNNVLINGILNSENAKIELVYSNNANELRRDTIEISQAKEINAIGMIARQWAQQKIDYLTNNSEINNKKDEIQKIGQEFSIVTDNTSLIVLETLSDYLKYEITPPEEFLTEYNDSLKNSNLEKQKEVNNRLTDINDKVLWSIHDLNQYKNANISFDSTRQKKYHLMLKNREDFITKYEGKGFWDSFFSYYTNLNISEEDEYISQNYSYTNKLGQEIRSIFDPYEDIDPICPTVKSRYLLFFRLPNQYNQRKFTNKAFQKDNGISTSISSKAISNKNNSNSMLFDNLSLDKNYDFDSYRNTLTNCDSVDFYHEYLNFKKSNNFSPVFYMEAYSIASLRKFNNLSKIIVSNLAEIQISNHEFLRTLAHQLEKSKFYDDAEFIYKKLCVIRNEEPQSFRDLALCNIQQKKYQEAADLLYNITQTYWDSRFNNFNLIVLNELGNLINAHTNEIDISKYDPNLIDNFELDLRIIIDWSSDNTDVDLWVIEPTNERCFYANRETFIGGKFSVDFRGGYGPEEYILKNAISGKYQIRAKYYGDRRRNYVDYPIINAKIYRNWSRPNQTMEEKSLVLDFEASSFLIGEIEIK